jgi:hypothetical protein
MVGEERSGPRGLSLIFRAHRLQCGRVVALQGLHGGPPVGAATRDPRRQFPHLRIERVPGIDASAVQVTGPVAEQLTLL